jgi:hypothetical protein
MDMTNAMKIDMHSTNGQLACVTLSGSGLSDWYVFELVDAVCVLDTIPEAVRGFIRGRFAGEDWRLTSGGGIQFGHYAD